MTQTNGNPHTLEVDLTDLYKVSDTLGQVLAFFKARDEMNAAVHAAPHVRYSPLTSNVEASAERLRLILDAPRSEK